MDAKEVLKNIVIEIKNNKTNNIYRHREIVENAILSVNGGSISDPNFDLLVAGLLHKLGLYDEEITDEIAIAAYKVAVKLGCVVPFKGWKQDQFLLDEIDAIYNKIDGSNPVDAVPIIINYLENHGIEILTPNDFVVGGYPDTNHLFNQNPKQLDVNSTVTDVYNMLCAMHDIPKDGKTYWLHSDDLAEIEVDLNIDDAESEVELNLISELEDKYNLWFSCYENGDLDESIISTKGYMTEEEYLIYND